MNKLNIFCIGVAVITAIIIILVLIIVSNQPIHITDNTNKDKSVTMHVEWKTGKLIACHYSTSAQFIEKPLTLTDKSAKRSNYDAGFIIFSDRKSVAIYIDCELNTGEQKKHTIHADKIPVVEFIEQVVNWIFK